MPLVTLDEAKLQLRITDDISDPLIAHKMSVAEEYVQQYVGPFDEFENGVPAGVKEAVLLMVDHFFYGYPEPKSRAHTLLSPYEIRVF